MLCTNRADTPVICITVIQGRCQELDSQAMLLGNLCTSVMTVAHLTLNQQLLIFAQEKAGLESAFWGLRLGLK